MATLIEKEIESSKKYNLSTWTIEYKGSSIKIARISKPNIALVEAFIHNDSDYYVKKNPTPWDSEYWFAKLKEILLNGERVSKKEYQDIISNAVKRVDITNSTHLNGDNAGWTEIPERISKIPKKTLVKYLKDPKGTDYKLYEIIKAKTSAPKRARENASFASKFCAEACLNLFKGTKYEDNYSKFDNVVKKALPYYAQYYNIDIAKLDLNIYQDYQLLIDKIRNKSTVKISRYAFDHLLWYYFKARM